MNKEKTTDILYIILILAIVTCIIVTFNIIHNCKDCNSFCKQFYPIYTQEVRAKILRVYKCNKNLRISSCIDIIYNNEKYTFVRVIPTEFLYDSLQKGDSVVKSANTYDFDFYRNGKFILHITEDCPAPDTTKK